MQIHSLSYNDKVSHTLVLADVNKQKNNTVRHMPSQWGRKI